MIRTTGFACVCFIVATATSAAPPAWKPLFNGKNLDGWTATYASKAPENASSPASYFDVEKGELHAYRDEVAGTPQPNVVLTTNAEYQDYVLSLEYRWGEKKFAPRLEHVRDAGLLYHVHRDRPNDWPASAEAQIQEGDTGDSWAITSQLASFVNPKTERYALPENGGVPVVRGDKDKFERTRHGQVNEYPGWNTVQIIVRGDKVTHLVNGVVNMRVSDLKSWDAASGKWVKLERGKIALQAESAEIFYRNVKIRPIAKEDDAAPLPAVTEVWFPVPAKVTPGQAGAPPSDAVILFDGKNVDAWKNAKTGANAEWAVVNGEMVVAPGTGDVQTKESFGDVQLHIEWCGPELPASNVNQDRGNSGVFLQDVYEVQVLDNFKNPTYVNGMVGSVYKQYPPLVNATLPAETWNVYDIIYTAPRFSADGSLASAARVTVLHNGVLVQNNTTFKGGTTYIGAPSYFPHGNLPLRLQDHGHKVRFRNIWLRKL